MSLKGALLLPYPSLPICQETRLGMAERNAPASETFVI